MNLHLSRIYEEYSYISIPYRSIWARAEGWGFVKGTAGTEQLVGDGWQVQAEIPGGVGGRCRPKR